MESTGQDIKIVKSNEFCAYLMDILLDFEYF
jgi:hypothetical protein